MVAKMDRCRAGYQKGQPRLSARSSGAVVVQSEGSLESLECLLSSTLLDLSPPLQHFAGLLGRIRKNVGAQDTLWPHRPVFVHWEDRGRVFASISVSCSHLAAQDYAAAAVVAPPHKCDADDVPQSGLGAAESPAVLWLRDAVAVAGFEKGWNSRTHLGVPSPLDLFRRLSPCQVCIFAAHFLNGPRIVYCVLRLVVRQ